MISGIAKHPDQVAGRIQGCGSDSYSLTGSKYTVPSVLAARL